MNDINPPSTAQDSNLESQVEALQRQVFLQLLALIVVTATVVFYLYYQSRIFGNDLAENRPRAMQIIEAYNRGAPAIEGFNKQLINYALTHREFQPVLMKYGWGPPTTTAPAR